MIKRWLRRRLAPEEAPVEAVENDGPRKRGALVRKGALVSLRAHVPDNREAFQRWYADPEIASLLRHDLEPLSAWQSKSYFDTFILPASARGICFAIHERSTKRLIGTTALTDRRREKLGESALFRIVIGEKDLWGRGYGTEATSLVAQHAFEQLGLAAVRLEVFRHNERAIAAYERVGFEVSGEHVEWVARRSVDLHVIEMKLDREKFRPIAGKPSRPVAFLGDGGTEAPEDSRELSRVQRKERRRARRKERTIETFAEENEARESPMADSQLD